MKVALVGSAPSSNLLAPFADPSWKIWACSPNNMRVLPRVDCWFELHGDLGWPEYADWSVPYCKWLNEAEFPVYAHDQEFIKRAIAFPKDAMLARFGCFFFTSTFAWMIAFAISEGAREIGLFGIDMSTDDEYAKQRQGFQHFLGEAQREGIKILAPDDSDILQPPPLYGYDRVGARARKFYVRKNEISGRIDGLRRLRSEHDWARARLSGARDETLKAEIAKDASAFDEEAQRLESDIKIIDYHIAHLTGALDQMDYQETVWNGHCDPQDDQRHTQRLRVIPEVATRVEQSLRRQP